MLFSLFDEKLSTFGVIMSFKTDEDAVRDFVTLVASGKAQKLSDFCDDFLLYRVGDFNEETGELTSLTSPILVARGFDIVKMANDLLKKRYNFEQNVSLVEGGENVCRNETSNDSENTITCR